MEPFTTNIPASKSPSAMKEWAAKGGKCSHWDKKKKKSTGEDAHLGGSVYYELLSFSERQQQLQSSRRRWREKIHTSHKTDLPTQLIKP